MPTYLSDFAPSLLAVLGAMAALLLDAWDRRRAAVYAAAGGLAAGGLWALWSARSLGLVEGVVAAGLTVGCLLVSACVLLAGEAALATAPTGGRLAVLAALASAAAALLGSSNDLGMVFLAVETLALCGYGIVALGATDAAREAAMKWFVQGAVATALFVVGIGVVLGSTGGSLDYASIRSAAETASGAGLSSAPFTVGLALVLAALAFKAGAFPFHSWAPDAYETAHPLGAAVLASAGKMGAMVATAWVAFLALSSGTPPVPATVLAGLAIGSIVFGNLAALRQRSFTRMLAYSGIAQVGYGLVGLPTLSAQRPGALAATIVFAALYGTASAAAFVFAAAVREHDPGWDGSIAGLAGLRRRAPLLAASLAAVMFSLTGIPLTAGFWGKLLVFGAAASGGWTVLAVVGVLGSVVSFGYYGSVLRAAFLDDSSLEPPSEPVAAGPASRATVGLAVVVVIVGILPLVTGLGPLIGVLSGR